MTSPDLKERQRRSPREPGRSIPLIALVLLVLVGIHGCTSSSERGSISPSAAADWLSPAVSGERLLLISIDGFRWDYLEVHDAPTISRLARHGVRARSLEPVFPSKTFPNHYSIVTGLRPDRHGVVANEMVDDQISERFALSNRAAVSDGRWWGGEPIWVTAERQGTHSATLFWPGSEAEIAGYRPHHWLEYTTKMPGEERVDQVLDWLDRPPDVRPRFLTLYFSEVDSAGHDFGPGAPETRAAIRNVDRHLDRLVRGLEARGLIGRDGRPVEGGVHIMLVSDHGMAAMSRGRAVFLEDVIDIQSVDIVTRSCIAMINPRPGTDRGEVIKALETLDHVEVWAKEDIPEALEFGKHPRVPEILMVADEGWWIGLTHELFAHKRFAHGMHGFDHRLQSMHGFLIAHGQRFGEGRQIGTVKNVDLYNVMAEVLSLEPAPNEGAPPEATGLLYDR